MWRRCNFGAIEFRKLPFRRLGALALLALASLLIWSALVPGKSDPRIADESFNTAVTSVQHSSLLNKFFTQHPGELAGRPLYPYSIVPGGVQSAKELRSAIANDPVVAEHYFGFDLSKARVFRLDKERSAYLSYRIDKRVFWTKKKMRLAKGETLVTDGAHLARTRCGNRVSETPQAPVSPMEPTTETLNTALDPPQFAQEIPLELASQPLPSTETNPVERSGRSFIPPIFPIFWSSGPGSSTPIVPPPPPPPPPPTPEPGTLILFSTGLSAVWLIRKNRKR